MKKFLLTLCICLATLAGASAQEKGDMAIGLNLGAAPCLESGASCTNFGIGAKFQYQATEPIRLEADAEYWFKAKGIDIFDLSVNAHYLFKVGDKLTVYPLVGIGYARLKATAELVFSDFDYYGVMDDYDCDLSASTNKFLVNIGIGMELPLSDRVSFGAEIKYQYIKDFCRLPINVGLTYRF